MNENLLPTTERTLSEKALRVLLEKLAASASAGCGSSYDLYVSNFSASVDYAVSDMTALEKARALALAYEWDYATPEQRRQIADEQSNMGYCSHGIELNCCPVGCGDAD